jgi:hypothetical protein
MSLEGGAGSPTFSSTLAEGIGDGFFECQRASFRLCCLRGVISVGDGRDPGTLLLLFEGDGQPQLLAERVRSSKQSRGASGLTPVRRNLGRHHQAPVDLFLFSEPFRKPQGADEKRCGLIDVALGEGHDGQDRQGARLACCVGELAIQLQCLL